MVLFEEADAHIFLERTPVSADAAIIGDDVLEDTGIVVGVMPVFRIKDDVTALVSYQILIV